MPTIDEVHAAHHARFAALIAEHGPYNIPTAANHHAGELLRAGYILATHPDADPATILRTYGVTHTVIHELCGTVPDVERRLRRADKYAAIIDYCTTHAMEQVTPEQVAEIGGLSYSTAIKFIKERVDLFRSVKRGIYEIRDPKADRAAARS